MRVISVILLLQLVTYANNFSLKYVYNIHEVCISGIEKAYIQHN